MSPVAPTVLVVDHEPETLRTVSALGEIQLVGGLETRRVDVQALAAANHALQVQIAAGRFRRDPAAGLTVARVDDRPAEPAMPSAVERALIPLALRHASGNEESAAQLLGVSRRAPYRRIARLGLESEINQRSDARPPSNGHGGPRAFAATSVDGASADAPSKEI